VDKAKAELGKAGGLPATVGDRQTIPNWDGCSSSDWHLHTL